MSLWPLMCQTSLMKSLSIPSVPVMVNFILPEFNFCINFIKLFPLSNNLFVFKYNILL